MNLPTKSAPVTRGELTPEDAERFAALFKPIWELDDAPFAQTIPGALTGRDVQQLGRAGVHPDVQLASNGTAAAAAPHAPPPAYHAPQDDGSIVLDIEPDPTLTPPPAQHRPPVPEHVQQVVHAQLQQQPMQQQPMQQSMHQQAAVAHSPRAEAQRPRRSAPPAQVRAHLSGESGDFIPAKKSSAGLFVVIGVVALLGASGIAYKVVSSNKTDESQTTRPAATTPVTREEPRIPPPPPPMDLSPTPTTTAKPLETAKSVDTAPAVTAPVVTAPPVVTTTTRPPPVVTTTAKPPPVHTATTKPTGKAPGGGIVRDNPF